MCLFAYISQIGDTFRANLGYTLAFMAQLWDCQMLCGPKMPSQFSQSKLKKWAKETSDMDHGRAKHSYLSVLGL